MLLFEAVRLVGRSDRGFHTPGPPWDIWGRRNELDEGLRTGGSRPARSVGSKKCQRRFLLGRWVRAEAAAVFAAGLDLGSRKTLEAADAARLLVTSPFFLELTEITRLSSYPQFPQA